MIIGSGNQIPGGLIPGAGGFGFTGDGGVGGFFIGEGNRGSRKSSNFPGSFGFHLYGFGHLGIGIGFHFGILGLGLIGGKR